MASSTKPARPESSDQLYEAALASYGGALERLARGYEPDPHRRQDLLQEIHIALWQSFFGFDGRCSLRTWVYRVAHNRATSVVSRPRARAPALVSLEEVGAREEPVVSADGGAASDERLVLERVYALIEQLRPIDRQVMLLYLEGEDATTIGEVTGLSKGHVATKVSRIKQELARRLARGGHHGR